MGIYRQITYRDTTSCCTDYVMKFVYRQQLMYTPMSDSHSSTVPVRGGWISPNSTTKSTQFGHVRKSGLLLLPKTCGTPSRPTCGFLQDLPYVKTKLHLHPFHLWHLFAISYAWKLFLFGHMMPQHKCFSSDCDRWPICPYIYFFFAKIWKTHISKSKPRAAKAVW